MKIRRVTLRSSPDLDLEATQTTHAFIFVQNAVVCHSKNDGPRFSQRLSRDRFPHRSRSTRRFRCSVTPIRVFFANLAFLASVTLVVYLPGKLATATRMLPAGDPEGRPALLSSPGNQRCCFSAPWWSRRLSSGLIHYFRNGRTACAWRVPALGAAPVAQDPGQHDQSRNHHHLVGSAARDSGHRRHGPPDLHRRDRGGRGRPRKRRTPAQQRSCRRAGNGGSSSRCCPF